METDVPPIVTVTKQERYVWT